MDFENKTLILQAQNVALEFVPFLENGWTQIYLQTENERHFLGAQTLKYILQHLRDALDESIGKTDGFINSEPVFWVLSLSEKHSSFYANNSKESLKFYIQNKKAETEFVFALSLAEKSVWKKKLAGKEERSMR